METIASLLRQERERKGIALQEVERQTHIPLRYLELLEGEGDKRLLADPLYLLPLLRTYADFLGMNSAQIAADFTMESQESQQPLPRITSAKRGQDLLTPPPQRSRTFSFTVVLVVILITLAIIGQLSNTGSRQSEIEGNKVSPLPSLPNSFSTSASHPSPSVPSAEGGAENLPTSPRVALSPHETAPRLQPAETVTPQAEPSP